jgi:hypothetical protein
MTEVKETPLLCAARCINVKGKDGIKREVGLARGHDGEFQFIWEAWWAGEDKEPLRTTVRLSTEALNATMDLLAEFQAFPDRFPAPYATENRPTAE